jgi:hypothetical protein
MYNFYDPEDMIFFETVPAETKETSALVASSSRCSESSEGFEHSVLQRIFGPKMEEVNGN